MELDPRPLVRNAASNARAGMHKVSRMWCESSSRKALSGKLPGLKNPLQAYARNKPLALRGTRAVVVVGVVFLLGVSTGVAAMEWATPGQTSEVAGASAVLVADAGIMPTEPTPSPVPVAIEAIGQQPTATPMASPTVAAPTATPTATPTPEAREDLSGRSGERAPIPAPPNATAFQSKFILSSVEPAQESQRETGVPASVTIAQAALESDWGRSGLAVKAKNYFGIKATAGPGPAGVVNMATGEYLNGANVTVVDGFRAYNTVEESFEDHGQFLRTRPRYAACFETKDPREFARRLQRAGYATDPQYASKLIKLMDKFNLYAYDLP